MGRWSVNWLYERLDPTAVEAEQLMWWMHRRVDPAALPDHRMTVRFDHTAPQRLSYWIVFEQRSASVCVADPGFDTDAVVISTTEQLARVFSGAQTWHAAVRSDAIVASGTPTVLRGLPTWFVWSPWADDVHAVEHHTG